MSKGGKDCPLPYAPILRREAVDSYNRTARLIDLSVSARSLDLPSGTNVLVAGVSEKRNTDTAQFFKK